MVFWRGLLVMWRHQDHPDELQDGREQVHKDPGEKGSTLR